MKKALVAVSGGVDSSVAALETIEAGFNCIGATMKLFHPSAININPDKATGSDSDIEDAKAVCEKLGIEHLVFDFAESFKENVINRFICAYESGLTPNPCIECNKHIKWKLMFEKMEELGCDYIVTGHYARIEFDENSGKYLLKKGKDEAKDQSYVLYNMTQSELAHTLLPIGELSKAETRERAEKNGFINSKKKDSQDICFIPDGDYAAFIENETGKTYKKGHFIRTDGTDLGEHKGLIHYTIGQRRGLGLALDRPGYVIRKDMDSGAVIIGDNEDLFTRRLVADEFNWISGEAPKAPIKAKAKTRYRHKEQPATIIPIEDGRVEIIFDEPQRAITEGQAAVIYDGDTLLGGGRIIETEYNF